MIEALVAKASDGERLVARSSGAGGNGLLFVHGVGSTAAIWDRQLAVFGKNHRALAIELRGNGAAPDPHDLASISRERFARDAIDLADAAGMERFDFVGCSLGGVVGFELWRSFPERIASFTLVGSYAAYPDGHAYAARIVSAARAAGSMEKFARERAAVLGLPADREAETIEQMARKSLPAYCATTQATWTGDYRALLSSVAVPALVVCGERDAVAPLALSREIAAGVPGASLHVLPGAGHVANADAPDAFNALLAEFLDRAGPAR